MLPPTSKRASKQAHSITPPPCCGGGRYVTIGRVLRIDVEVLVVQALEGRLLTLKSLAVARGVVGYADLSIVEELEESSQGVPAIAGDLGKRVRQLVATVHPI